MSLAETMVTVAFLINTFILVAKLTISGHRWGERSQGKVWRRLRRCWGGRNSWTYQMEYYNWCDNWAFFPSEINTSSEPFISDLTLFFPKTCCLNISCLSGGHRRTAVHRGHGRGPGGQGSLLQVLPVCRWWSSLQVGLSSFECLIVLA